MVFFYDTQDIKFFIKKFYIKDAEIDKLLKSANRIEKVAKFFVSIIVLIVLPLFIFDTIEEGLVSGLVMAFIASIIPYVILSVIMVFLNSKLKAIENRLYRYFKDKVDILFLAEKDKYDYDTLEKEQVEFSKYNDAVKYFTLSSIYKGADGVMVHNKSHTGVVSGEISTGHDGYVRGNISTEVIGNYDIFYIKNIKLKEDLKINNMNNLDSKDKDLEYWFNLKEKGAITQEEYEQKKRELL